MPPSHVVSQGLAEGMKAAGWPQEGSAFVWIKTKHAKGIYFVTEAIKSLLTMPDTEWCALPLATELLERMPKQIPCYEDEEIARLNIAFSGDDYSVSYEWYETPVIGPFEDKSLPDALAKLALHLMKEGKITF